MKDVIERIERLNSQLADFWSKSDGWAPEAAAALLGVVRLDWQVSLSVSLKRWASDESEKLSDGDLILAWVNLGSLIEGSLKLLLSVYLDTYLADLNGVIAAGAPHKDGVPKSPDSLRLEKLKVYCRKKSLLSTEDDKLVDLVQARRNAVHAFQNKSLGNADEFRAAVRAYLLLLRRLIGRLPYPDEVYVPREI